MESTAAEYLRLRSYRIHMVVFEGQAGSAVAYDDGDVDLILESSPDARSDLFMVVKERELRWGLRYVD